MIIKYKNKTVNKINLPTMKATEIEYEISEEDIFEISFLQQEELLKELFLTNDHKKYDLVSSDSKYNRILIGGLRGGKAILTQYTVEKGKDELLKMIAENSRMY